MTPDEHAAITGHIGFFALTAEELIAISADELGREPEDDDLAPDWIATCEECGYPVTYTALVPVDQIPDDIFDWIMAVEAQHFVNNAELRMNGFSTERPFGWKEEYVRHQITEGESQHEADYPDDA